MELHVPGTVLRGNNDILALTDNLESVLSGFPIANAMQGERGRYTTVQCKATGNLGN